jgi:exodeoxyribonuclease VII large subunit
VQGEGAVESLVRALDYFEKSKLADVIIIGRGGGSIEDLWAFNSELLARKIFSIDTPIISAVGHETDFTICDFVCDMRAPTPSAAAELAVPDVRGELRYIDSLYERGERALLNLAKKKRESLQMLIRRSPLENANEYFDAYRERVRDAEKNIKNGVITFVKDLRHRLALNSEKANALSPLKTLGRGYSIAEYKNKTLRSVRDINSSDEFTVTLSDGKIRAVATEVMKAERGRGE